MTLKGVLFGIPSLTGLIFSRQGGDFCRDSNIDTKSTIPMKQGEEEERKGKQRLRLELRRQYFMAAKHMGFGGQPYLDFNESYMCYN